MLPGPHWPRSLLQLPQETESGQDTARLMVQLGTATGDSWSQRTAADNGSARSPSAIFDQVSEFSSETFLPT